MRCMSRRPIHAFVVGDQPADDDHGQRQDILALEWTVIRPQQQQRPPGHQRRAGSHSIGELRR